MRRTSVVFFNFTDEWIICFSLSKEKALVVFNWIADYENAFFIFNTQLHFQLFFIRYILQTVKTLQILG